MLMGILLAYLTLRTKSIWPAVVVHFTNNATSVTLDFLGEYSAFDPLGFISNLMSNSYPLFMMIVLACAGIIVLMIMLINKIYARNFVNRFSGVTCDGKLNERVVGSLIHPNISCEYARYKPTAKDLVFYVGAIFVTVVATILTLVWGVF